MLSEIFARQALFTNASPDGRIRYCADASQKELGLIDLTFRFKIMGEIINAKKDSAIAHRTGPFSSSPGFYTKSVALKNLNNSISHTAAYINTVENIADRALGHIAKDTALLARLRGHIKAHDTQRMKNLRETLSLFSQSAQEITGVHITSPYLTFSDDPPENKITSYAYFLCESKRGEIHQNKHESARFHSPVESIKTLFHEFLHATEHQFATLFPDYFPADRKLYDLRHGYKTTVPTEFLTIYKSQYHERVAFDTERHFGRGLQQLINPNKPQ